MATITDSIIHIAVKHLRVDSRGFLQIATVTEHMIPQFCPFKTTLDHCGTWCPHFHINVDELRHETGVTLTCSGTPVTLNPTDGLTDESE